MKRLALSVLGGVAIPFLYSVVFGPLTTYTNNETLNHYLGYPVRWPVLILYRWFPIDVSNNETFLLLLVISCNVLLYTLLTYCVLFAVSKRKVQSHLPPPPLQQ